MANENMCICLYMYIYIYIIISLFTWRVYFWVKISEPFGCLWTQTSPALAI